MEIRDARELDGRGRAGCSGLKSGEGDAHLGKHTPRLRHTVATWRSLDDLHRHLHGRWDIIIVNRVGQGFQNLAETEDILGNLRMRRRNKKTVTNVML